jgi:hypothetical protein
MTIDPQGELGESVPRLVSHWIAACFGHFLTIVLPLVAEWPRPVPHTAWPHWLVLLAVAVATSSVAAIVNANLPVTARELVKSVALGAALNAMLITLKLV